MKNKCCLIILLVFSYTGFAQPVVKDVLKVNRDKLYRNLVNNTINKNISSQLTDSTEEQWQDAFYAMELIHYHSPWVDNTIRSIMPGIKERSNEFQRAILELIYTNYAGQFNTEVRKLLDQTTDSKIFAMCMVNLLNQHVSGLPAEYFREKVNEQYQKNITDPLVSALVAEITDSSNLPATSVASLLNSHYLPGNTLLISIQRRNRNYPGIAIVRDANGNFMHDDNGNIFTVPQLARSITNLPGFLTNGNTPEGIFRMDGMDHSKSSFIGPTTNIQLTMPFEYKAPHFFKDSTLDDNDWDINRYRNLLPQELKKYDPLLEAYFAGKAGRTAIIAHGTAVDPNYYKGTSYYPLTPTQGCLCTKEIWNDQTGMLIESDQQKLADTILAAGGANGYCIVINIDDQQRPVTQNDILSLLELAGQK